MSNKQLISISNQTILELKKVSVSAPVGVDFLLQNISFAVNQGEKIAIVGASGSGKTSLLRLLNYLISPVEGELFFQEISYSKQNIIALRQQIMLVPQEPKLLGMTVKEALIYPLQLQKLEKREISNLLIKYCDALQIPQIWLDKNELQLSLGQRQLISLVRALMLEPKILLLDEPTSALDGGNSDCVLTVLNYINQTNHTTILMVNHQLEFSAKFAERILYLKSGKLLEDAPTTPEKWQQIDQKIRQESQKIAQEWDEY